MINHKKKLVSASLLFVGMLSFTALNAEAATTDQGVQDLRYCTINNIYKTPRADCPLRQDRILDRLDQDDTRPRNGKQDGTGPGRANGPRVPDCPNYEEKQAQPFQAPAAEPAATAYAAQPQDGMGNQYGQQNNSVNNMQQGNGYGNNNGAGQQGNGYGNDNAAAVQQTGGNGIQDGSNVNGGQQNNGNAATPVTPPSTTPPQTGGTQPNGAGRSGTHHGLRDGSGAGGQRGRNSGHCY